MNKRIFVLLGGSGTGKTSIGLYMRNELNIPEIVSHTTRAIRPGEVDGVTYYYVSEAEFETIEKIEEVVYSGNRYCISKEEIDRKLETSDKLFVICDKEGMLQLKKHYPDEVRVVYVYISLVEMAERMRKRGDNEDNIAKRLAFAHETGELNNIEHADYVVINRNWEETKRLISCIVE